MNCLFIDACVSLRGPDSRTRALLDAFWEGYRETHPDDACTCLRVSELGLKPLTEEALRERDALAARQAFSDPLFAQARLFQAADQIVVAAPFWDLSFPALLRVYIEHISVCGLCYHYDEKGCHGDCRASRLAYLTTGGDLRKPESLGVLYWKQLAEMFGIPRFDDVFADGLDLDPEKAPERMVRPLEQARQLGRDF